jgi:cytochrome c553
MLSSFQMGVAVAADAPAGAASCSGCHPVNRWVDSPVPRLAGYRADDMLAAMQAFKSGKRPATVMDRIAKGYSDDEIRAIAAWYAAQK